ncbi:hypothetical protein RISK_002953 [Rhodopirellula islandica]|uniref:Uncharacterized protein n=1 Tax=Rhodopirellula islandica TaxID=595434 RepID=A0A0J1BEK8_RHOIS|nr:hypothetical protein RISK_002953 [Rhodopirellula islandica]
MQIESLKTGSMTKQIFRIASFPTKFRRSDTSRLTGKINITGAVFV